MSKKYRPSNGSEGEAFKANNCHYCKWFKWHDFDGYEYRACPIELATQQHEKEDKEYPNQWTYDEDGKPTCTAFRVR